MKRLAFMLCLLILVGCSNRTASKSDVEFLTVSKNWYHFDEVTGESEKMSFRDDFTFYWGCECGEPIGNSDCYELFDYDKETSIITLYNDYDEISMELEVLDYSDYHLLLNIDGEIKDYTYSDSGIEFEESEKYFAGYSGEFALLGGSVEEVILGPFDYDGDEEYPENATKTYQFTSDVEFYTLNTFTHIKDGEVVENTIDYAELDIEEAAANMEYGGYVFIWFDEELHVNKMMWYGDTRLEE